MDDNKDIKKCVESALKSANWRRPLRVWISDAEWSSDIREAMIALEKQGYAVLLNSNRSFFARRPLRSFGRGLFLSIIQKGA